MNGFNIIIADDHPVFRTGMELLLNKCNSGYQIFHASNGFEVINLVRQNQIHLILMDMRMPSMDGICTTRNVKGEWPGIKIIGLSMVDSHYEILQMFNAGIDGYLLKNSDSAKIKEVVNRMLNKSSCVEDQYSGCLQMQDFLSPCKNKNDLRDKLTGKEIEVLKLICHQLTSKEISTRLGISLKTVELHRSRIIEKTHSRNMIGLVLYAIEKAYITDPAFQI